MTDFVQLWVYLSSTPLFGLNATLVVYVLALAFYTRMGQAPWANPVLWSILVLGRPVGHGHGLPHPLCRGAVHPLPARARRGRTGRPLWSGAPHCARTGGASPWRRWRAAQPQPPAPWAGLGAGAAHRGGAVAGPKSVTAPVAMGIADKVGGIASLAAVFAVLTGLVGALSGKALFALLGIGQDATGWMARGLFWHRRPRHRRRPRPAGAPGRRRLGRAGAGAASGGRC